MINAIIMASGLGTRMGENKLLLDYKGIPIIEHVFKSIKNINFNKVIVVSQYEEVLTLAKKYNYLPVKNENAITGQSESIKLGILNSGTCDGFMFFVADQPFINKLDIEKIINNFKEDNDYIVIPKYKSKTGNPVIFPFSKKEQLLELKGDEKGKKVVKNTTKIKYIEVCEKVLSDIDTKEDYEKIRGT
ncbi:molybdenum cofactor cytidylyltransferase [Romboutsia sp.]|uniref:molybdenum cofactor cytidylyltransferase n=1 Tax=Romboutsia sp. TaxID=1965302 RepID=UPI003F409ADE